MKQTSQISSPVQSCLIAPLSQNCRPEPQIHPGIPKPPTTQRIPPEQHLTRQAPAPPPYGPHTRETLALNGLSQISRSAFVRYSNALKSMWQGAVGHSWSTWCELKQSIQEWKSKIFERQPSKKFEIWLVQTDHITSSFLLKAVFHNFYQVHSWIIYPKRYIKSLWDSPVCMNINRAYSAFL